MIDILAKNYLNREDLDRFILAEYGSDPNLNKDTIQIKGTAEELKKLFLSDSARVFGSKVICTDFPTKTILENKKNGK